MFTKHANIMNQSSYYDFEIEIDTAERLYTVTSDVSVKSPTVDSGTLSSTYTLQTLALQSQTNINIADSKTLRINLPP